jgi:hypothetical protein
MTVYNDPQVKFGGAEVGGIRISHLSDIDRPIQVSLTATRGKKALHRIDPMKVDTGPALADVLAAIAKANNKATMSAAKALVAQLKNEKDTSIAVAAYNARAAELRKTAATAGQTALSIAPSDGAGTESGQPGEQDPGKTEGADTAAK